MSCFFTTITNNSSFRVYIVLFTIDNFFYFFICFLSK
nr:MAG TPA: hypothetical protein [Caudoviricetes sp.]DAV26438.1 MAG TPA: hypothetical protein [Caudoviricetes sp.]